MRGGRTIEQLRDEVRRFANARAWGEFHTPKNLAMALAVEAAELMEHFQWLTPGESAALPASRKREVAQEIADVLIYLVRLSDVLGIAPLPAAFAKLSVNARKYPVARTRGSAVKYSRRGRGRHPL
jgi:NTP pyrophosphatase (non-canonical NTP hydrolase)